MHGMNRDGTAVTLGLYKQKNSQTAEESDCNLAALGLSSRHPDIVATRSGAGASRGRPETSWHPGRIFGDIVADIARLESLIAPVAENLGFELVRVIVTASEAGDGERALQVMAEDPATGQLTLDQCGALSRGISAVIDPLEEAGEELIQGHYYLEVSSPGIDRPLTRPKDYANWAGHEAKISLIEKIDGHRNFRGELTGIDGETVTIADRKAGEVSFPMSAIHSAKLVLTDVLIAATRPLDTSGADEIIEVEEEKALD